jgi:regulator of sigma E protease
MIHFLVSFWDYVIVFLIVLTVVVFIHELGHFIVARANGIKVEVFSIGFGPELFGRTDRSGTRWKLSLLPFGGYVRMYGDADAASTPGKEDLSEEERGYAFRAKKVHQRAAVIFAGPAANFVFGILVLAVLFLVYGQAKVPPVVGDVRPESAAAAAGLQPGDRVEQANGQKIDQFKDLQKVVSLNIGQPLRLVLDRKGVTLAITAYPRQSEVKDAFGNVHHMPLLGITAPTDATEYIHFSPAGAVWAAVRETGDMVSTTFIALSQMITGDRSTEDLGGPLGIAKQVGQAAHIGISMVIFYVAMLSINLGMVNLLPVPMLDGGHLLFYAIEAVWGRPLGERAQEYSFRVGLFLVFALMLLATRNDLVNLRVWEFIKGVVS